MLQLFVRHCGCRAAVIPGVTASHTVGCMLKKKRKCFWLCPRARTFGGHLASGFCCRRAGGRTRLRVLCVVSLRQLPRPPLLLQPPVWRVCVPRALTSVSVSVDQQLHCWAFGPPDLPFRASWAVSRQPTLVLAHRQLCRGPAIPPCIAPMRFLSQGRVWRA